MLKKFINWSARWPVYFILFSLKLTIVNGQEGNNWTFWSQLGMSFNTEPPTFFKTAQNNPWFCSSVSDSLGNLLFYTNGDTVWDKNHSIMNGGILNTSEGCKSIGQGVIILQNPSNKNNYYIFQSGNDKYYTPYSSCDSLEPLKFAIVDIKKNNGLGTVVSGYTNITTHNCYEITACYQANKHDYWIVTRTLDSLVAIPFTSAGIGNPIYTYAPENIGFGNMKLSHNSNYLISVCNTSQSRTGKHFDTCNISVYGFDVLKGKFSDAKKIFLSYPNYTLYGVEFSPNDSFCYITVGHKKHKTDTTTYLFQLETYSTDIEKSLLLLNSYCGFPITTAINLAPNGKIYFTSGNGSTVFFNVITKPDLKGNKCEIKSKYIEVPDWGKQKLNYSFPNILYRYIKCFFDYSVECKGSVVFRNLSDTFSLSKYIWYWGDGDSNIYTNSLQFVNHVYKNPGKYFVKLKGISPYGYVAWNSDTVEIFQNRFGLQANFNTSNNIGCQYVSYDFNDKSKVAYYDSTTGSMWHWYFGDGSDTSILLPPTSTFINKGHVSHKYTHSGNYDVKLVFKNGYCSDTFISLQKLYITKAPQPGIYANPNSGCIPQVFNIKPLYFDSVLIEKYYIYNSSRILIDSFIEKKSNLSPAEGFIYNHNSTDTIIYIKQFLLGSTGCITQDSTSMFLYKKPNLKLMNDTFICKDEILQISALAGYKYLWSTGDTTQNIIVKTGGTYSVKVINGACAVSDSVKVIQDLNESCKFRLLLFPNPCYNQFTVSLFSRNKQNINIQLYDLSGRQVASYDNVQVDQFENLDFDVKDLASAMYILRLNTIDKKYILRFVKLIE